MVESDHQFSDLFIEEENQLYESPEMDSFTPESYDEYLSAQVILPCGDTMQHGEVVRCRQDHGGRPIGKRNANPILDTREYEVQFPDGSQQSYMANKIAENLYSQVDSEGRSYAVLQEIICHESDDTAIRPEDLVDDKPVLTTKGWRLLVTWKDGTSSLVPLCKMKDSYPVQTAEYAIAKKLAKEPAFKWWIAHVLRKRDRIIKSLVRRNIGDAPINMGLNCQNQWQRP